MCLTTIAGCGSPVEKEPAIEVDEIMTGDVIVPDGNVRLDISDYSSGKTEGYGCQVDTHIFKESCGNFYTDADLKEWLARIDDMNLQSIRTQIFPEWYERGNDNSDYNTFDYNSPNVDFNSIEMQQLYKLLDICEERNIKVDLSFYGCNGFFESQDGLIKGSWLANSYKKNWITAPKLKDVNGNPFAVYEEYAESVNACLNYLLNVKKYTCLYEFSIYPEPNGSFFNENGSCVDAEYVKFYKVVYNRLLKDDIVGKIKCTGPGDCANDIDRYKAYINDLRGVYDKNSSSVYMFNNDNSNEDMYNYALQNVTACKEVNNTWGVCECGTNRFVDPANQEDTDTYERAIFLARMLINYTNAGCTNIKYWVLNDVNYGGYIMRLGLWKTISEKDKAQARPQFYSWSLITKYTDFGSEMYSGTSSDADICITAYRLPNGKWTYLIANNGTQLKKVSIVSRHSTSQGQMNVYELSGSTMPSTNRTITSSRKVTMADGVMNVTLRSKSFTVISGK